VKGTVYKNRPLSGDERDCPVRTREEDSCSSDADVRTFWCKIFKFMVCPHGQGKWGRGFELMRIFSDKGKGDQLFAAKLLRQFLWTTPNVLFKT